MPSSRALALVLLLADPLAATASTDVADLSLEALLDAEVSVATLQAKTVRESAAVITVVTREDIEAVGARDLIDVLQQVPGFQFGVDVEGAVGAGFRGNWGHEGKVLFLLDGQELNEPLYSTVPLGLELPVEQIDRVEVLRGPGSAIYGGAAELAVVNILTRGAEQKSATVSGGLGMTVRGLSRRQAGFQVGHKLFDDQLELSLSGSLGQGSRSDATYRDVLGAAYDLRDDSDLSHRYVNASAKFRGARLRFLHHDYRVGTRDGFDAVLPERTEVRFLSDHLELAYDFAPTPSVTVTPRVQLKQQTPWRDTNADSALFYDKTAQRVLAGVSASVDPLEALNVLVGVEGALYRGWLNRELVGGTQTFFNGTDREISFRNLAVYGQVLFDHWLANLTVGARYELHSQFGASFVPRVGLTRVFGKLHCKLLYATAFRAPSLENLSLSGGELKPERTAAAEAELGYELTRNMYFGVNLFDLTIRQPIVYSYDAESNTEGYVNFDRTGSRGVEVEYRLKGAPGSLALTYSFSAVAGKNTIVDYEVPDAPGRLLAFAQHKATLLASVRLTPGWRLSPSAIFLSERSGYDRVDADGETPRTTTDGPLLLANVYLTRDDLFTPGLDLSVGISNLLDAPYRYFQPYNSGHAPLPAQSREYSLRLTYGLDFGS